MNYATIKFNDIANAEGICVSVFLQGCPHKCEGCFNPETWRFDGGKEFTIDTLKEIINGLTANGIHRNLCILGGEPLCYENAFLTYMIISEVKSKLPDTKIFIWTGYTYEYLKNSLIHDKIPLILDTADYLIDGPFIYTQKDITLKMRGSKNQRIWDLKNKIDITENF